MEWFTLSMIGITLITYSLVNALVMSGLFVLVKPDLSFVDLYKRSALRTVIAIIITYGFFALIARMFCWTAYIAQCLQCICPTITMQELYVQSTIPATLMFYLGVTAVQAALIAIPQRLSPGTFIVIVAASNLVASLLKLGFVSIWTGYS